jgi:hypothetical protein
MIFAKEINDALTGLVKKLDAEVAKKGKKKMAAFVIILTDDSSAAEAQLKELASKNGIKHVSLAIDSPAGPPSYKLAKDAAFTCILYSKHKVVVNHAFKKGEFDDKSVEKVCADLPKLGG